MLYFSSNAQEFRKFKTGLGFGVCVPSSNNGTGLILYSEPGYRITDVLLINLRLETILPLTANADAKSLPEGLGSLSTNAQYYISKKNFRPFAGLGLGLFRLKTYEAEIYQNGGASVSYGYESKPGFYTRAGLDLGHLNLSIDYNFVTASTIEEINFANATPEIVSKKSSNSYVGFRLGISIGGGRISSK